MKKFIALVLAALMVLSLAACGQETKTTTAAAAQTTAAAETTAAVETTAADIKYPEHGITLTDLSGPSTSYTAGLRLLQPYVEKYLGVTMTIEFNEVGSGWGNWTQCLQTEPTGYDVFTTNFPAFFSCYNPELGHTERWDDFDYLISFCTDENCLFVRNDSPIQTVEDFINYVKNNSKKTIVAVTPVGGDDHIAYLKLAQALPEVFNDNTCELMHANSNLFQELLGGFVDVLIGNVGNYKSFTETCRCICVFSDKRSALVPDVPTFNEEAAKLGYKDVSVVAKTARGLCLPKGMDEAVKAKLTQAFVDAYNDPAFKQEFLDNYMGYDLMYGDAYKEFIAAEDKYFQENVIPLLGWDKK